MLQEERAHKTLADLSASLGLVFAAWLSSVRLRGRAFLVVVISQRLIIVIRKKDLDRYSGSE
jgi:hypothetical protein